MARRGHIRVAVPRETFLRLFIFLFVHADMQMMTAMAMRQMIKIEILF